mmetsp:Transcript_12064/g.14636  ORF Transcript_12064/g.14636 Transcript_12064/m.14636 type:complete len:230 (+) Transcript_12064:34-723(+)
MIPRLRSLVCKDGPSAWKAAGFFVNSNNQIPLGAFNIQLQSETQSGKTAAEGATSWLWSGIDATTSSISGVETSVLPEREADEVETEEIVHPNGVTTVDHLVLRTSDVQRTKAAFEKIGVPLRRETDEIYPGLVQLFYRPADEVIIEVIGAKDASDESSSAEFVCTLWGVTFNVNDDLSTASSLLKGRVSKVRKAKQKGRSIMTLRNSDNHPKLGLAVALMTPHVRSSL